jgi:hypothetical protein
VGGHHSLRADRFAESVCGAPPSGNVSPVSASFLRALSNPDLVFTQHNCAGTLWIRNTRWCCATEHSAFFFCYRILLFHTSRSGTNADCFPRIASSNPCRISAYTTLDVIPHFACRPLIALVSRAKQPSTSNIDVRLLVQLYFHE